MTSLTGKFTSARGWTLFLVLLFGAGLMISACGEDDAPTPTTPTPTTPTPPTPPPTPPPDPEPEGPVAPSNLRVSDRGSNYLEWSWDAVEGASGYNAQFSPDETFDDTDTIFVKTADQTSQRVENLAGDTTGHMRVQSFVTDGADVTRSDWTSSVAGTTSPPPVAQALAAPDDFESSDPDDSSIVLDWDSVSGAAHYEVEQRADGGSGVDAVCDGADGNEVEQSDCIATDLEPGTDYEFRVRAIPDPDDPASAAGEWAETAGSTTGTSFQQPTVSGGSGDLNVTWSTIAKDIVFSWEPVSGVTYEWDVFGPIDSGVASDPCAARFQPLTGSGSQFEVSQTANAGEVWGICVRTGDEDNRATSFAVGVGQPAGASTRGSNSVSVDEGVTTALTWENLRVEADFDYEIRVAEDPHRDDSINMDSTNNQIQAACDAGALVDQGNTDVRFDLDEITVNSGLTPYAGYLLCFRLVNTTGATGWAVPADNEELSTTPGRPPTPTIDSSRTTTTTTTESVVWTLAVRNQTDVPRSDSGYQAVMVIYNETYQDTKDSVVRSTPAPRVADCVAQATSPPDATDARWDWKQPSGMSTDNNGIVIRSGDLSRNAAPSDPDVTGDSRVAVCVRAQDRGNGPWVISSAYEVRRQEN